MKPILLFILIFIIIVAALGTAHRASAFSWNFGFWGWFRGNRNTTQPVAAKPAAKEIKPGYYDYSFKYQGINRKYEVYVPSSYDGSGILPVVIGLHGGGGSIKSDINNKMPQSADKLNFLLVMPEGTGKILLGQMWAAWNAGTWATGQCCGDAVTNNIDDVGFISKVIDEVEKNYNVDSKRIYATGLSNGAMMAIRLGCELSNRIAAIAPVSSPAVPSNCHPSRKVPMIYVHGTSDPCVPYNGGQGAGCIGAPLDVQGAQAIVDYWKQINTCSNNSTSAYQNGAATCSLYPSDNGADVEFCSVQNMGHAWPSGAQYFPVKKIGSVSYDISFDQMWDFLKKYSLK